MTNQRQTQSGRYLDLCTLELVCARDKTVVATLRVEMREEVSIARNGNAYRKLRISRDGVDGHDWAAAFAQRGDETALGVDSSLDLRMTLDPSNVTGQWIKQEIKVSVFRGATVRTEILACEPVSPKAARDEPRPKDEVHDFGENFRRTFRNPFESTGADFFGNVPRAAPPSSGSKLGVWREIEPILKRQSYRSKTDISRVRKAMALLLQVDTADDASVSAERSEAMARANAFLDQMGRPFRPIQDVDAA